VSLQVRSLQLADVPAVAALGARYVQDLDFMVMDLSPQRDRAATR